MSPAAETVDDYLAGLPEDQQAALTRVRETIKEAAPDATEAISYGIPGYKFKGRPLIHFGAAKNHCAIYGAAVVEADKAELEGYNTSKGTIRFSPGKPLPDALITKFVQTRIGEIEAGAGGYGKARQYMSKLRLNITMTLDGYVAGPNQSLDDPLGEGGEDMHTWMYTLKTFREQSGQEGGKTGTDDDVLKEMFANVGAVIMGRNMFYGGGRGGPWKGDEWKGWWGDNPPYHMPVFVLTHHPREPQPMEGGTTFHFVTDGIESALQQAREAAGDKDVLVMGGARNAQQYLAAGLIDEMDIHLSPVLLGAGERLFDNIDVSGLKLEQLRAIEGSGVTHLRYRVKKAESSRGDGQPDESRVTA